MQFHNVLVGCMEQGTIKVLGEANWIVGEVDVDEDE